MQKILVGALVCGLSTAAFAAKDLSVSTASFTDGVIDGGGVAGPAIYSADYEAPAYAVGALAGQAGWTASSAASWSVSAAMPAGGLQHARNANDPGVGAGTLRLAFSPALGPQPVGPSSLSIDVKISGVLGADYDVVPQAPSQAFLSARVKFFYGDADGDLAPGDIMVLDDLGGGLGFVPTGAEYVAALYKNLRIEMDPVADTLKYFYDGVNIYNGVAGVFAGTAMEQVVLLSDNFQNPGETGDFDNLRITPEPASLLALGTLGLVAIRRRR